MARKARIKALYSTYWIEQTCSEAIFFANDEEKGYFLNCLKRSQQQYGFYLIGYRLQDAGYQMILYDNGNDITKIMRTLNIEYALKVARSDFKLKSRFKSEILPTNSHLLDAIKRLTVDQDCNPYNSYSHKCNPNDDLVHESIAMAIFSHNRETYTAFIKNQISLLDDAIPEDTTPKRCEKNCIKTLKEGKEHLDKLLAEKGLTEEQLFSQKALRNSLIQYFRKNSVLSLKEIGILFGGMTESAISKIIRRQLDTVHENKGGSHVIFF